MPWTSRKANKWVVQQMKPETSLQTKTSEPKPSCPLRAHHGKAGFLGKDSNGGKTEVAGKEEDQL